ncbi:RNB-domain-containing protein [Ascobolus immersus RN42]|uniref:Ribosomal RNA-processing protein 44 n=1 Tax=Ascobolus immersus RN42 TaxID=1160509 RepID=A0A3N4I197_ASCIM|nr:RNB-domain-containing protein [Ascobolus immersus RN42]
MTSLKRSFVAQAEEASGAPLLSSKVFLRSGRGRCTKVVRELYLRQDIPCSSKLCQACTYNAPTDANGKIRPFILSETPAGNKVFPNGHYLIPDTNIFLNCMDALEHKSAFYDVIVLQTVLEEVRNRSLPLYNRLRSLTKSEDKRFYVFHNDFRRETYITRNEGETINDRNDRAVRKACTWYQAHLVSSLEGSKRQVPDIVMVSDDKENLRLANEEGIKCCNIRDYINGLENPDELLDRISSSTDKTDAAATAFYAEYYSQSKITTGLKAGLLHQGPFSTSPYNFLEGSVITSSFDKPLIIQGRRNINRAVQGDIVVVEVLPKEQWKLPSARIVEEDALTKNDNPELGQAEQIETESERLALVEEARRTHNSTDENKLVPTAKVVGIVRRNWRQYVGHIDPSSVAAGRGRSQQSVFLIAMDKRIPKIRIKTRQAESLLGQRIVVTIDSWEKTSRFPSGHFVRALGELESKEAETEALLLEWDVQYRPFPQSVLDCLPKEGHEWRVPEKDSPLWKGRKDLRDLMVCSIDPPGCTDIDDALHARPLPNGNYQVGVHIADVSHFVKPGNAMDLEAASRGTTVYLVDKRIDMLPMLLGTDLCSLKPYVERFAFSVLWEMTPDAEIVSAEFTKSAIKSVEAFSYEQAQLRIDDINNQDDLTKSMRTLLDFSKKLKKRRMDAGALNLASPEVKVHTDSETSDPVDVETKQLRETNSLVEEFMLLANITVARKIYEAFPQTAMLRRHGAPPATNFEELQSQLRVRKNMDLRVESSKALADSLDTCVDPKEPFFNTLIRIMATRCMLSAEYFAAGAFAYPEFRHYGLASEIYTHFTSPIRRYADVIAHRQLAAAIEYEPVHDSLNSKSKLEGVCQNINVRHRNAQFAGRASVEYYVGQALKGKVTEQEGFVMRLMSNGFVVFVARFGIEGLIRTSDLDQPEPDATYDDTNYVLTIHDKKKPFQVALFDKVRVTVEMIKEERTGKRKIQLKLVR